MKALLALAGMATVLFAQTGKVPVAPRPPMGWNSFNAYDCGINEQQFRATVDFLASNLRDYGWQYAVVDFIWFNPVLGTPEDLATRKGNPDLRLDATGRPIDKLTMDRYGRLLPAVERFPSAAGGKGFRPIADYVHSKGLKFGIHIMRGVPRQAYFDKTPILGTQHTAADIADPGDTCPWLNNMYGIDPAKPGAQAYYDSLLKLYASWGVDFLKVDDILAPPYHKGEIEMIRRAIDRSGRRMVLSLSPGEAPLTQARHVRANAQMWRMSADFWDEWAAMVHNFDLLNAWSPWIGPDSWPDADMLPVGHLSLQGHPNGPDRMSNFTWPEHYTLMSLWSIARSPLMMGGDLLTSSEESLAFLKNREVLAVNQSSINNHQVFHQDQQAAWIADVPGSADKYLALFNLGEERGRVSFVFRHERLLGKYAVRDLWAHKEAGVFEGEFAAELDRHGAGLFRLTPRK